MLPFTPRLRIALATAEAIAKDRQRREVTCSDILMGIVSLSGGVADSLLKAKGISPSHISAVPLGALNHETSAYSAESLRALAAAMQDVAGRSRQLVGIEDMLIGVLSSPSAEVSAIFAEKNVNMEELLSEVRKQM